MLLANIPLRNLIIGKYHTPLLILILLLFTVVSASIDNYPTKKWIGAAKPFQNLGTVLYDTYI